MPVLSNFCAETSFTEMYGCTHFGFRVRPRLEKYHLQPQWTSAGGRYPVFAMYSVLSWTKKLQCERNEWCYELHRLDLYRMVSWFQIRYCMKSTFIKHAHCVQMMTLDGRMSVRPSASATATTRKVASMYRCVKSIADISAQFWSFITPYIRNTTRRKCALKPLLTLLITRVKN